MPYESDNTRKHSSHLWYQQYICRFLIARGGTCIRLSWPCVQLDRHSLRIVQCVFPGVRSHYTRRIRQNNCPENCLMATGPSACKLNQGFQLSRIFNSQPGVSTLNQGFQPFGVSNEIQCVVYTVYWDRHVLYAMMSALRRVWWVCKQYRTSKPKCSLFYLHFEQSSFSYDNAYLIFLCFYYTERSSDRRHIASKFWCPGIVSII